jgi:hypothetical protein
VEETLPDYQTTPDSLPEEPEPITLPTFTRRFFQTEKVDAETTADPPVIHPTTKPTPIAVPLPATGDTSLPDPLLDPLPPTVAETRQTALTAFLAAPRLRDPTHIQVRDISILLHLLRRLGKTRGSLLGSQHTYNNIPQPPHHPWRGLPWRLDKSLG